MERIQSIANLLDDPSRTPVIVGYCRTPFGTLLGSLTKYSATDLAASSIKGLLAQTKVQPNAIEQVVFGNVMNAGVGQSPAKQITIKAGLPLSVPSYVVGKVCGSGMVGFICGCKDIKLGEKKCVIVGGTESMTNVPYLLANMRGGAKYGDKKVQDGMEFDGLFDPFVKKGMGVCVEEMTTNYNITRKEMDDYTISTYEKYLDAKRNGFISKEITGIGSNVEDDQPKKYNKERICKLPPAFGKKGKITAASASPLSDGAAALLLCSLKYAQEAKLKPRAKILAYADAEVPSHEFPVAIPHAIVNALKKAHLRVEDIGCFEINEAFAAVPIIVQRMLSVSNEKMNVHGGAIAIGHPLGTSGARIIGTLLCVMEARKIRYGCAGICNGGGGGTAVIIERID